MPVLPRRALHRGVPHGHRRADVHPQDRHRQRPRRGPDDPVRERARLLVRARLPGRGALRGGLRLQRLEPRPADRHRPPAALRDRGAAASRAGRRRFCRARRRNGKRVACVGAGPASLACASYLALEGCRRHRSSRRRRLAGGLNTSGVAPYKMPADDALAEVEFVRSLGVEIRTGVEVAPGLDCRRAPARLRRRVPRPRPRRRHPARDSRRERPRRASARSSGSSG